MASMKARINGGHIVKRNFFGQHSSMRAELDK
jgi:hypothetical protein